MFLAPLSFECAAVGLVTSYGSTNFVYEHFLGVLGGVIDGGGGGGGGFWMEGVSGR